MKKMIGILTALVGLIVALAGAYSSFKKPDTAQSSSSNSDMTQSTTGKNSPIINSNGANGTFTFGDTQK